MRNILGGDHKAAHCLDRIITIQRYCFSIKMLYYEKHFRR